MRTSTRNSTAFNTQYAPITRPSTESSRASPSTDLRGIWRGSEELSQLRLPQSIERRFGHAIEPALELVNREHVRGCGLPDDDFEPGRRAEPLNPAIFLEGRDSERGSFVKRFGLDVGAVDDPAGTSKADRAGPPRHEGKLSYSPFIRLALDSVKLLSI
jgi:hypothetical protein